MMPPAILCIGSAHWDVIGRAPDGLARGDDVPGRVVRRPGGVAFNIARALAAEGLRPTLLAAIGADADGAALADLCAGLGIDTGLLHRRAGMRTGVYVAVEDPGGLVAAIADPLRPDAEVLNAAIAGLAKDAIVILDGTLPEGAPARMAQHPSLAEADLRLTPANPTLAFRLKAFLSLPRATLYLNRAEAEAVMGTVLPDAPAAARALRAAGARRVLVTDGAAEAVWADAGGLIARRPTRVEAARVTGAGDAVVAAHVAAELRGAAPEAALEAALAAAARHVSRTEPA